MLLFDSCMAAITRPTHMVHLATIPGIITCAPTAVKYSMYMYKLTIKLTLYRCLVLLYKVKL